MDAKANATDTQLVNFTGNCGETTGNPFSATSVAGMQVNQSATINGGPCSNCMIGNDGAVIESITLLPIAGYYDYQISVYGQGPSGAFSGSFYLAFTDATGDTYYLSLYSSRKEVHTVDFNSKNPAIMKIWWCDDSFSVPSDQSEKADFRVTSPVRG